MKKTGRLPEYEIGCIDVMKPTSILLFDHFLESHDNPVIEFDLNQVFIGLVIGLDKAP